MQICSAEVAAKSTRCRLSISEENCVNHKTTINRRRNCTTNGRVNKWTLFRIELNQSHWINHRIAFGCHIDVISILEANSINVRNGIICGVQNFAVLHGRCACRRIRNESPHNSVEIRQALFPVIFVFIQTNILPFFPFNEFKRPSANRLVG